MKDSFGYLKSLNNATCKLAPWWILIISKAGSTTSSQVPKLKCKSRNGKRKKKKERQISLT